MIGSTTCGLIITDHRTPPSTLTMGGGLFFASSYKTGSGGGVEAEILAKMYGINKKVEQQVSSKTTQFSINNYKMGFSHHRKDSAVCRSNVSEAHIDAKKRLAEFRFAIRSCVGDKAKLTQEWYKVVQGCVASKTFKTYQNAVASYEEMCKMMGLDSYPVDAVKVSAWLACMDSGGTYVKPEAYLNRKISALKRGLELSHHGVSWLSDSELVHTKDVVSVLAKDMMVVDGRQAIPINEVELLMMHRIVMDNNKPIWERMIAVVVGICTTLVYRSGGVLSLRHEDIRVGTGIFQDGLTYSCWHLMIRYVKKKRHVSGQLIDMRPWIPDVPLYNGYMLLEEWFRIPSVASARANKKDSYVFPSLGPGNSLLWEQGMKPGQFRYRLATICEKYGLRKLTGHSGRRGGAQAWMRRNAPKELVRSLGGWVEMATLDVYLNTDATQGMLDMMEKARRGEVRNSPHATSTRRLVHDEVAGVGGSVVNGSSSRRVLVNDMEEWDDVAPFMDVNGVRVDEVLDDMSSESSEDEVPYHPDEEELSLSSEARSDEDEAVGGLLTSPVGGDYRYDSAVGGVVNATTGRPRRQAADGVLAATFACVDNSRGI